MQLRLSSKTPSKTKMGCIVVNYIKNYIAQRSSGDPITGNGSGALGTTICAQTPSSESSTSSSANRIYFGRSTKYKSSFNCAVCCK